MTGGLKDGSRIVVLRSMRGTSQDYEGVAEAVPRGMRGWQIQEIQSTS
jgi:hypothetical protein